MTEQRLGLIAGRYKVVRLLHLQDHYAAVQAVDIMERQKTTRLLNIYDGDEAKRYASVFYDLKDCPEFIGILYDKDALVAVFCWYDLPVIDKIFYGGNSMAFEHRLDFMQNLFHLSLRHFNLPAEVCCAAMQNPNLCADRGNHLFKVNYCIVPHQGERNEREFMCLIGDQTRKIILPDWSTGEQLHTFLFEQEAGRWHDVISLNSAWNDIRKSVIEDWERIEKLGFVSKLIAKYKEYWNYLRKKRRSIYGEKK